MLIKSEQEAIFLACEMESAAVHLYERAMLVMQQLGREGEELYLQISLMLADEQEHLRQFRALYTGLDASIEQQLSLSAIADGILFEGGLMGAVRQGLLTDVDSMLKAAILAEAASAKKYREFAELTTNPEAKSALLLIAAEEDKHLNHLVE
ncbi:MAG: hypothetical protein GX096_09120 [Clostridiales bacterium]|nr:hypothetical protein [Clostridiales bacterium]